jgi:hypothetical protein
MLHCTLRLKMSAARNKTIENVTPKEDQLHTGNYSNSDKSKRPDHVHDAATDRVQDDATEAYLDASANCTLPQPAELHKLATISQGEKHRFLKMRVNLHLRVMIFSYKT